MTPPGKVEALLFDMGGVVIDIDFDLAIQSWARQSHLSIEEIRSRFSMDAAYERHERAEIDASEYFEHLRNTLELEASDEEISNGWNAIYVGEITRSTNGIAIARAQLPCYLFTNSNPTHQAAWMAMYPRVMARFDGIFVSSELGLRKPERAAFDAVAEAIGLPLSAILFFDDTLENVEGARSAGMWAVHVQSPEDLRQALVELGALEHDKNDINDDININSNTEIECSAAES